MTRRFLYALCFVPVLASAQTAPPQDTLMMTNGERRPGRILSVDAQGFSVEVQVVAGQAAGTIRVPRASVTQIEFAPDAPRDLLIARGTAAQLPSIAALWPKVEPFVSVPRSPAARLGLRYAGLLLETKEGAKALALYSQIEKDAWNPDDRNAARQGRLRGMVATGKEQEAVAEAYEIIKGGATPEVQAEARYIVAKASDTLLRKLLEDNPRWEEDDRVRPERHRLYNDAVDGYLYPSLFAGAATEPAARGLWGAINIYKLTDETPLAVEAARDIVVLHPASSYVKLAQEYLASLPEDARKQDFEKDARSSISTQKENDRQ